MSLHLLGYVELPENTKPGGFDHASFSRDDRILYVAHTSNDALDLIDCASDRYLRSIADLGGVAGALVCDAQNMVFTSNRAENTIGILSRAGKGRPEKVAVGEKPNGLAYAAPHHLLLAANVGDPARPHLFTVSMVDVLHSRMQADIRVPGRTRWTVYDEKQDVFFVNIAEPSQILVIEAVEPFRIRLSFHVPAAGPHGLDLDTSTNRLFCACDGRKLVVLDALRMSVLGEQEIGGSPDVIFFNAGLRHLYVAIGDPGIIEVYDTDSLRRIETVMTEKGAHTLGFDPDLHKVYAFLPQSHRAAVFQDC
jgi:DNA-binding beta-propeller fold protein YncE